MSKQPDRLYNIGNLKDDPAALYDMAVAFSQFFEYRMKDQSTEIWQVLERVNKRLWSNLPPVVVIDLRDPDDPSTWGEFGETF